MKLTILIPVFNEQATIEKVIKKINKVKLPNKLEKEIIVINDGSTDQTKNILERFKNIILLTHKTNQGKGQSIITGLAKMSGDILIIQDGDLEYNPNYYPKLLKPILENKTDIVYGTRLKHFSLKLFGKNKTPLPLHFFGNKLLTKITNLLYGSNLSDMETCYKVFTKKAIKSINLTAKRFDIEPEITSKLLKKKYKIVEVSIKFKPRTYKQGKKILWTDGFIAVWVLIRNKFSD